MVCYIAASLFLALNVQFANAAGLGNMRVQSNLGATFRGEIDLNQLTPDEEASLTARIPSAEIYRQAGLEYSPAIAQLRVAVGKDGRPVLYLSSTSMIGSTIGLALLK